MNINAFITIVAAVSLVTLLWSLVSSNTVVFAISSIVLVIISAYVYNKGDY